MLAPKTIRGCLIVHMVKTLKMNIVFIMQDFDGVDFGWCLGLRCSSLGEGGTSLWVLEQTSTNNVPLLIHVQTFYVFVHLCGINVKNGKCRNRIQTKKRCNGSDKLNVCINPGGRTLNCMLTCKCHLKFNALIFFCFREDEKYDNTCKFIVKKQHVYIWYANIKVPWQKTI